MRTTLADTMTSFTSAGDRNASTLTMEPTGEPSEVALFFSGYRLRSEIWAAPLVAFAAIEMFLVASFEAYVIVRVVAGRAPYRNFYLNQVQLLGNFMMSAVALFYASDMNPMYCVVVRFGTGMSYALVFAAMLVKSVFYLSVQNGVYLPTSYQALLLLFALLPQVILGIQWLVTKPPSLVTMAAAAAAASPVLTTYSPTEPPLFMSSSVETMSTTVSMDVIINRGLVCGTPYRESVMALVYVMFLLAFVAAVSFRAKALREAQGDQWWLGVTVGMCIILWLMWILTGAAFTQRHRDGCLGMGLITISAAILVLTAFPQGARLARAAATSTRRCHPSDDDALSIRWEDEASTASSLYSPSFFHYKPPKSMASDSLDGRCQQLGVPPRGRFTPEQKMELVPMKVKMPDGSTKRIVELTPRRPDQSRHNVHKPSKRGRFPSTENPEVFYLKGGVWSAPMMY